MARNLEELARQGMGHLHGKQALTLDELEELKDLAETKGLYDSIYMAYKIGVGLGYKKGVSDAKKKA